MSDKVWERAVAVCKPQRWGSLKAETEAWEQIPIWVALAAKDKGVPYTAVLRAYRRMAR